MNEKRADFPGGPREPDPALRESLAAVYNGCAGCDLCQNECAFLKRYGKPKGIADRYDPARKEDLVLPFECSLCGLCTAVCPKGRGSTPQAFFCKCARKP